ncbi:MAG: DUF4476 domain-containing protein [Myxococcaceae bacterium]|nr:DUF4476 domain-containing protein [Myxococcaceae bacterium]
MLRTIAAVVVVCALNAQAQSVSLEVGGMRAGVDVRMEAPVAQAVVEATDGFRLDWAPAMTARLAVSGPVGLGAQVWCDGRLVGQFAVPFSWDGRPGQVCRVLLATPDGTLVLDRQVTLAHRRQVTLVAAVQAPPPAVVVMAPQPAPMPVAVVAPAPLGMPGPDFDALTAAVRAEDFASDKLGVIRSAIGTGAFLSCAQAGALVDLLDMSSDKVEVVTIVRRSLVDPRNGFALQSHFTFSSDKEKVRRLLGP